MEAPLLGLIIRDAGLWGMLSLQLRTVMPQQEEYVKGAIVTDADSLDDPERRKLAQLCLWMDPANIYAKVGHRRFSSQKQFVEKAPPELRRYVQQQVDLRICQAVKLAAKNGVLLFKDSRPGAPLQQRDELEFTPTPMALHTLFRKQPDGIDYKLTIGHGLLPMEQHVRILCNVPSLFIVGQHIMQFGEGLNGKLLQPFLNREWIHIPKAKQSEYLRLFVLRIAGKIDIEAEGFSVEQLRPEGRMSLVLNHTVNGKYALLPRFTYGSKTFEKWDHRQKSVTLHDNGNEVGFVCVNRDRNWEREMLYFVKSELSLPDFGTLNHIIEWSSIHKQALKARHIEVEQPEGHRYYIGDVKVTQSDDRKGDWFRLRIMLHFDNGETLPLMALREALVNGEPEYLLPSGNWFVIPELWFSRYAGAMTFGTKGDDDALRLHISQRPIIREALGHEPKLKTQPVDKHLPVGLKAHLRPYQKEGYEWLLSHYNEGTGCCLSDDMGLGKTVQTIALILKHSEKTAPTKKAAPTAEPSFFTFEEMSGQSAPPSEPVLVLSPASVVFNWRNELERFAPSLRVLTYTGVPSVRQQLRESMDSADVVITTYQTMRNDIDFFEKRHYGIIVYDEAQVFKNRKSQVYEAILHLHTSHSVALSGTPIENSLEDLWSLMSAINPQLLGDREGFVKHFIKPINDNMQGSRAKMLRELVAPFFLRRLKTEVLDSLPERQDEIVWCNMTPEQASAYEKEESSMRNLLLTTDVSKEQMTVIRAITRLRQIACCPRMIGMDADSGKMDDVFLRLEELHGTSHKVLIFSEYVSFLQQVEAKMKTLNWKYAMLTGASHNRDKIITHFQETPDCQFFLISLKAGGVGLNLTEADYVFLLDPWWNLSAEEQAISRAHRMGQRRSVFVYRFISSGTLEEQILKVQDRKQSLVNTVLGFEKLPVLPPTIQPHDSGAHN